MLVHCCSFKDFYLFEKDRGGDRDRLATQPFAIRTQGSLALVAPTWRGQS